MTFDTRADMFAPASIAFAASAKSALGQLQRVTNVAAAVHARHPGIPVDLVTTSPLGADWARRSPVYRDVTVMDTRAMAERLSLMSPGAVVVGSMAVPGLEKVDAPLCLILREVIASELQRFRLAGGRPWDLVVVPNPTDGWLPDSHVISARRLEAVGWIYRRPGGPESGHPRPADVSARKPTVLVTSGGGTADHERGVLTETLARLIESLRRSARTPFSTVQARGPFVRDAWMIPGVDEVIEPGIDLHHLFSRVDLVISTAGYNSVLELACTDVPTLLVPIGRYTDDQYKRAGQWGPRIGRCYEPQRHDSAVEWLASVLDGRQRRPPVDLGESGAFAAATLIEELVRAHCPR